MKADETNFKDKYIKNNISKIKMPKSINVEVKPEDDISAEN